MTPHQDQTIETHRLTMRMFERRDVDELHKMWTDPDVRRFLWDDVVITRDQAAEVVSESILLFQRKGVGFWVVMPKGSLKPAGFCGLREFGDDADTELVYGLYPKFWGKGFATEAALAVLERGFLIKKLERIYAGADPPNLASFKVMRRIGMRFDKQVMVGGLEAIYYVINRTEYNRMRK